MASSPDGMESRRDEEIPLMKLLGGHHLAKGFQEGYIPSLPGEPKQTWFQSLQGLCSLPTYRFPKAKGRQHPVCFFLSFTNLKLLLTVFRTKKGIICLSFYFEPLVYELHASD